MNEEVCVLILVILLPVGFILNLFDLWPENIIYCIIYSLVSLFFILADAYYTKKRYFEKFASDYQMYVTPLIREYEIKYGRTVQGIKFLSNLRTSKDMGYEKFDGGDLMGLQNGLDMIELKILYNVFAGLSNLFTSEQVKKERHIVKNIIPLYETSGHWVYSPCIGLLLFGMVIYWCPYPYPAFLFE